MLDLEYMGNITFTTDCRIVFTTILRVVSREGVTAVGMDTAEDYGDYLLRENKISSVDYERRMNEALLIRTTGR